jgi:hypothetical protein
MSSYIPFLKRNDEAAAYGPPRPAPGGITGWINDRVRNFKNRNNRSATGAYEGDQSGGAGNRGRFDPDEAWDTRVGHDPYREEQELGYRGAASSSASGGGSQYHGAPAGDGYNMNLAATPAYPPEGYSSDRGRSPGLEAGQGKGKGKNPFDDDNEVPGSLRGVSPRPIDTSLGTGKVKHGPDEDDDDESPAERRSIFRENM